MKKLISIVLSLVMVMSMCITASAVEVEINTTDAIKAWKYESNFASTDTAGSLLDDGITFTSPEKVSCYNGYITTYSQEDVTFNPSPMLSGDYTFETQFKISNTNDHYLEFNKTEDSYYKLQLFKNQGGVSADSDYAKKIMRLSKVVGDTTTVLSEVNYSKAETGWWSNNTLSFTISQEKTENGLKITAKAYSSRSKETVEMTYTDTADYLERGSANIHFEYCGVPTVYYINAYSTPSENVRDMYRTYIDVSNWKGHTEESLNKLGLNFIKLKYASTRKQFVDFVNQGNGIIEYAVPSKNVIPSSYELECVFAWLYNKHNMRFNVNGSNYYTIEQSTAVVDGVTKYTVNLNKVVGDSVETLASQTYDTNQYEDTYAFATYKIKVEKENGVAHITLAGANDAWSLQYENDMHTEYLLEATDSSPLADGTFRIMCNYTGSPKLQKLKCTVKENFGGLNQGAPATYTKSVTYDKNFGANDTVDGALKEGINLAYNKAKDTITFANDGATFTSVAGVSKVKYTPGSLKSDNYTFSSTHYSSNQRASYINFNMSNDEKNYYQFKLNLSNDYSDPASSAELYKVVNGASELLASTQLSDKGAAGAGGMTTFNVNISGNTITASAKGSRHGGSEVITYTDANILPSGDFIVGFGEYGGTVRFNGVSYSTDRLVTLDDECFFYVNGAYATSYSKGKIAIEAPVRILGKYVVTAVLYQDYEMTDIVTLTPEEFANGKVQIFDTTNSTADTGMVRVFFFDSENTLNSCGDIYELN